MAAIENRPLTRVPWRALAHSYSWVVQPKVASSHRGLSRRPAEAGDPHRRVWVNTRRPRRTPRTQVISRKIALIAGDDNGYYDTAEWTAGFYQ